MWVPYLKEEGRSWVPLLGRREIINPQKKRLSCQIFKEALAVVICYSAVESWNGSFGAVGSAQSICLNTQPCSWAPSWMWSPENTLGGGGCLQCTRLLLHGRVALRLYEKWDCCLLSKHWRKLYTYGGNTPWSRECRFFSFFFFLGKKRRFRFYLFYPDLK